MTSASLLGTAASTVALPLCELEVVCRAGHSCSGSSMVRCCGCGVLCPGVRQLCLPQENTQVAEQALRRHFFEVSVSLCVFAWAWGYPILPSQMRCPVGQYSMIAAGSCSPCPLGRYGATSGLTTPSCTGPCAAGYQCGGLATVPNVTLCSPGRYSLSGFTRFGQGQHSRESVCGFGGGGGQGVEGLPLGTSWPNRFGSAWAHLICNLLTSVQMCGMPRWQVRCGGWPGVRQLQRQVYCGLCLPRSLHKCHCTSV